MNKLKSDLKIVEYYESEFFANDDDFDDDDLKMEYYEGEFWIDCDKVYSKGNMIAWIVQVNNELIVNYLDDDIPIDFDDKIKTFYDNNIDDDFEYLENGMFCSQKENKELYNKMINSYIGIAFRGGSGYSYGFHCYNK